MMTTDLLLFIGAVLGALVNRLAGANPSRSWATLAETASAGGAMVLVNASGLIPAELREAMSTNPFRVGLFAFMAGLMIGPGLITLSKSLFFRFARDGNGKPNGQFGKPNGQSGSADLGLLLAWLVIWLVVMVLLTGCASLGYQRSSVSFPRDDLLLLYADIRHDYGGAVALVEPACLAKTLPEVTCAKLAQLRERFAAGDRLFRAAVVAKRDVSLDDLRGLIGLATELGRLAGYPVPNLGGLGARP
jgi:hypothetical protein